MIHLTYKSYVLKNAVLFLFTLCWFVGFGQPQKTKVLTLGTFHFEFRNRDVSKIAAPDQIDVLEPAYQKEIEDIVSRIDKFNPTIIVVERDPALQFKYDSLYGRYLQGEYMLGRDEVEQIGFRLAKKNRLNTLHCVNDWGKHYEYIDALFEGTDSIARKHFMEYFYRHSDTADMFFNTNIFKTKGILADLKNRNSESNIDRDLGNYLVGVFKYEQGDNQFFGADFTTGWWFNRNLRIFRNIQKIKATPEDRVLVIYGAGHMNLLNLFFKVSPEYELLKISDYLK